MASPAVGRSQLQGTLTRQQREYRGPSLMLLPCSSWHLAVPCDPRHPHFVSSESVN